jgi:glutamine amidotransferase
MCRFTHYLGPPIRLSSLLVEPTHSLIRQSTHSREREEPLNGDGFGIGWYVPELSEEPAVFRSITPAWNNRNLINLSRVVASPCIMAHVRAATQASGVNEANCHPFRFGRYLFMHNGDVGNFARVRRKLLESVCDEAFGNVYGSTDSEHVFAVFIDELLRRGDRGRDPAMLMAEALQRAIGRVLATVAEHGGGEPSYLNVAVSDGHRAVVSRFTNEPGGAPESLYYFAGQLYERHSVPARPRKEKEAPEAVVVSSERLTEDRGWREIPANQMVVLSRGRAPRLIPCETGEPAAIA